MVVKFVGILLWFLTFPSGIFSPTKVLHFFNAPPDFSEEKVHEVRILTSLSLKYFFSYCQNKGLSNWIYLVSFGLWFL